MIFLILSTISVLIIAGIILYNIIENGANLKWLFLTPLGFIWIVFGFFSMIEPNQVGVMYDPFKGGIQNQILGEGFKSKSLFASIYTLSTKVEEINFNDVSVQTGDSQWVNCSIQIQARIDRDLSFEYFKKYKDKNLVENGNIIKTTTQRELESITTKYNVMDLLGEKRSEIMNQLQEKIKNEMIKDGVIIERVVLVDTDGGELIENAIAKEATAKKEAEAAKYTRVKAEEEGAAKVITAQKEKEANELLSKTLTNEILREKWITKWNGILPTTMAGQDLSIILGTK